jgi:hypothetical protein
MGTLWERLTTPAALALARELRDPASEFLALVALGFVVFYGGDAVEALDLIRQALELLPADVPHPARRPSGGVEVSVGAVQAAHDVLRLG